MPDRHYIYDTEGRRALAGKELLDYYADTKQEWIKLAGELHQTLKVPRAPDPLIGDVFVLLYGALKANPTFIEALLARSVNLERAANKWFSYFAWLVVLENWEAIRKGGKK